MLTAGKTTLVDKLFDATRKEKQAMVERAMDSNVLEKERGITILGETRVTAIAAVAAAVVCC